MNDLEPIPFAGMVDIDLDVAYLDAVIEELYGKNNENVPKYVVLGDGSVYIYRKEEDRYAICKQTSSLQEGIPAAAGAGGTTQTQCSGESTLQDGQKGRGQEGQGH
jgi:hypothetical protein